MQVQAIHGVGSGGSSVAGKVAGLGRAAMFANFIEMMDEWIAMMKEANGSAAKSTGSSARQTGGQAGSDMLVPPSPFYTYKRDGNGQFSVQKVASADIAATLLLAIA